MSTKERNKDKLIRVKHTDSGTIIVSQKTREGAEKRASALKHKPNVLVLRGEPDAAFFLELVRFMELYPEVRIIKAPPENKENK